MQFIDFIALIPKIKTQDPGGVQSQFKLAPSYRKPYQLTKNVQPNTNKASVLLLFFPNAKQETSFILTQRATYNGHHSNQISLPGGKQSLVDFSPEDTALRETFEEIGISVPKENIIKKMTEVFIPPSNFLVTPYISYIDWIPKFKTNYEVNQVITPLLIELLDTKNIRKKPIQSGFGKTYETPYLYLKNQTVWGATAMILSEVIDLLKKLNVNTIN